MAEAITPPLPDGATLDNPAPPPPPDGATLDAAPHAAPMADTVAKFSKLYADPANLDKASAGNLPPSLAGLPPDQQRDAMMRGLNQSYAQQFGGVDQTEIEASWPAVKARIAKATGLAVDGEPTEQAIYGAIGGQMKKDAVTRAQLGQMQQKIMVDVLAGDDWRTSAGMFMQEARKDPNFDPAQLSLYNQTARDTAAAMQAKAATYAPVVQAVNRLFLAAEDVGEPQTSIDEAIKAILTLPPEERQMAVDVAAAHAHAQLTQSSNAGVDKEAQADEPGIIRQTAEKFSAGTMQMVDGVGAALARFTGGDNDKVTGGPEARLMLRNAFEAVRDPAENHTMMGRIYYGLVGSAEKMGMAIAQPQAAVPILFSSSYEDRLLQGHGAAASAAGAALDTAQNFIGGHVLFGTATKAMEQAGVDTVRTIAVNAAKRVGMDAVALGGTALADQTVPDVVQHWAAKLDASVPDVHFSDQTDAQGNVTKPGVWSALKDALPETALSVAVMSLVGAGVGALKDAAAWRATSARVDVWQAAGYSPEQAAKIAALPDIAGRIAEAQKQKPAAVGEPSQAEAVTKLDAEAKQARQAAQTPASGEPPAAVTKNGQGDYVTRNGSGDVVSVAADVKDAAQAKQDADNVIVFHGTDAKFENFDLNKSKSFGNSKFGHWFTNDNGLAGTFGSKIISATLDLKNPKVISTEEWNVIRESHAKDGDWFSSWKKELISQGYDGLQVKGKSEKFAGHMMPAQDIFAVFNDDQVKRTDLGGETVETGVGEENFPVSVNNASIDEARAARGLPAMDEATHKSQQTSLDEAKAEMQANPNAVKELAERMEQAKADGKSFLPSDKEQAMLSLEAARHENARQQLAAQRAEIEAQPDSSDKAARLDDIGQREEVAQDSFERFSDLADAAGTDVARSLAMRARGVNSDYSLAGLTRLVKRAQGGRELTPEQQAKVADLTQQLTQTKARLDEVTAQRDAARSRGAEAAGPSGPKRTAPVNRIRAMLADKAKQAHENMQARAGQLNTGLDPTAIADLAWIAAHHLAEGTAKIGELLEKTYGEHVKPHLDEIMAKARELHAQAAITERQESLARQIEAAQARLDEGKATPGKPRPDSPEIREQEKTLSSLRKEQRELNEAATPPETKDANELTAYKKRLAERVADLTAKNEALARGEEPPAKPSRSATALRQLDDEAKDLLTKKTALENKAKQLQAEAEETQKPGWQKKMDALAGASHLNALTGYHVLGKILFMEAGRLIQTPLEEVTAYLLNRARITPDATIEGGKPEIGRYYATIATRGLAAAKEQLLTGTTKERDLAGHGRTGVAHWWDFMGVRPHAAASTPEWTGKYEMYLAKRTNSAIRDGLDVNDDMVKAVLRKEAADYADRTTLREENKAASKLSGLIKSLKEKNPETGEPNMVSYAIGTLIDAELTKGIIRLPMNHAWQVAEASPLGLAAGALKRAAIALREGRGGAAMTPAEANIVSRLINVGALGSAFYAWAAIDAMKPDKDRVFGGFYEPRDHRGKDDVPVGQMRIAGVEIPRIASLLPILMAGQLGSTFMRVAQSKLRKTDRQDAGVMAATAATVLAVAEQAPVASQLPYLAKLGDAHTANDELGKIVAGNLPQLVREIAQDTDPEAKRKTAGVVDNLKASLPGLRETLPKAK